MRYELTDYEWTAIKPLLPNKARGVPRVNDRRVLNGIFWVLRSGAPLSDLPETFGPYTTCTIASFAGVGLGPDLAAQHLRRIWIGGLDPVSRERSGRRQPHGFAKVVR